MPKDYQGGAYSHHGALGDTTISKRRRSRAAKKPASGPASTAHSDVSPLLPSESAPITYRDPHARCDTEPCNRCNHAILVRLGIRRGPRDIEDYETGEGA